jgi:hypothetical protein
MKNIFILFLAFILISSDKNKDLNDNFRKAIIDYQIAYPIPTSKQTKKRKYAYSVVFYQKNNDTCFYVVRSSTGTDREFNFWGIYLDEELKSTIIGDDENLSSKMVYNKKRNKELEKFYFFDKDGPEMFPPMYRYLVKNRDVKLIKIDTLSENWER